MGSEYKFILFLVLAVVFLIIHLFSRKVDAYNPETFPAVGVIDMINQSDAGDTWYYIKLYVSGMEYRAKTDNYRRTPENVAIGDRVDVRYYPIANGQLTCYIDQQGFERVIGSTGKGKPLSLYCAVVFFILFAVGAVQFFFR